MGSCQSSALKITVFNTENQKSVYYFSLKQMRTFSTFKDVLNRIDIELQRSDRLCVPTSVGFDELSLHSQFQIQTMVVKNGVHSFRYRIFMERLY